jgi:hypothetical protein
MYIYTLQIQYRESLYTYADEGSGGIIFLWLYNTIERVIFTLTARYYIAPSTEFSFLSPGYEHNVKERWIYLVILADELY